MDKLEPLENERWIWAKSFTTDYSDEYLVSDMGRCWSIRKKKFIGSLVDDYWVVNLSKNGKPEHMMIGRLMLISFGIPIPHHLKDLPTNKIYCMHLDGDSHNNNLSNFAWGDNRENQNEVNAKNKHIGENNHFYGKHHTEETKKIISELKKKPILQYTKDGEFVKEWDSALLVEKELGIKHSQIAGCCNGRYGYKSAGGYIWKYKKEEAV